MYVNTSIYA